MKKVAVVFMTILLALLGGCSSNTKESATESTSTKKSVVASTEELIALKVYVPVPDLETGKFSVPGEADASKTVTVSLDGKELDKITPTSNNSFNITLPLPKKDTTYTVSDGDSTETFSVRAKGALEKEQAEKEAREKAEQEAQKKAEEEEAKKKAEEEAAAKKKAEEEEAKRKAEEAEAKRTAEEEAAKQKAKEAAQYDTGITYDNLARNPDSYKDEKVKFSGRIVQVMKGDSYSHFRFAVDDNYDQILYLEISEDQLSNNRLLEDDYITIKGTSYGEYTYTSTLGGEITIPGVIVDSFELQ